MKPIDRYLLIQTLPVNPPGQAGQQVAFPDIPELRSGVLITGIEAYTEAQLSAVLSGQANISVVDSTATLLVLQEKSTQRIQQIPFSSLVSATNGGIWKETVPFQPNWQSSYVQFTAAPAAAAIFVCAFGIFYRSR